MWTVFEPKRRRMNRSDGSTEAFSFVIRAIVISLWFVAARFWCETGIAMRERTAQREQTVPIVETATLLTTLVDMHEMVFAIKSSCQ